MFSRVQKSINRLSKISFRKFGDSHHHSNHNHVHGPYDPKHHATYPKEARLFGIDPATYKLEGN